MEIDVELTVCMCVCKLLIFSKQNDYEIEIGSYIVNGLIAGGSIDSVYLSRNYLSTLKTIKTSTVSRYIITSLTCCAVCESFPLIYIKKQTKNTIELKSFERKTRIVNQKITKTACDKITSFHGHALLIRSISHFLSVFCDPKTNGDLGMSMEKLFGEF